MQTAEDDPQTSDMAEQSKQTSDMAEQSKQTSDMAEQSKQTMKRLESLISESLQLYELDNQKANTADELVNSLRVITEYLEFSVNVLPGISIFPQNQP